MKNLKAIAEYLHRNGLSVTPDWMKMSTPWAHQASA